MKTGSVIATIGVVVIIIIVGMVAFRPQDTVAPTPTPTAGFEDISDSNSVIDFEATLGEDTTPTPTSEVEETPSDTTESEESEPSATISIDEGGFTPATITIAAGTTVTFVNNGQAPHWPASDNHPTHQILPGFDSKEGLATGETYSFTFTEVGEWAMHDHLQPANTGTIIVQ